MSEDSARRAADPGRGGKVGGVRVAAVPSFIGIGGVSLVLLLLLSPSYRLDRDDSPLLRLDLDDRPETPLQTFFKPKPGSLVQSHSVELAVPGTLKTDVKPFSNRPTGFSGTGGLSVLEQVEDIGFVGV